MKMSAAETFEANPPYSEQVADDLAELRERFQRYESWTDLMGDFSDPAADTYFSEVKYSDTSGNPQHILDIRPREIESTILYHLPMANGIDPNMMTRLFVLAGALPNTQIITAANPASLGKNAGRLGHLGRREVSQGHFGATVRPTLEYARSRGVSEASQVGFSYGADKALAAAAIAQYERYSIKAHQLVAMEPASIVRRSILKLGGDFGSSAEHLDEYVDHTNMTAYDDAREQADKENHGMSGLLAGIIGRKSNRAIARGIARGNFDARIRQAMEANPDLRVAIIWGSESELATDGAMRHYTEMLRNRFGKRVTPTRIEGQYHAMGDELFFHAAMVRMGLEQTVSVEPVAQD